MILKRITLLVVVLVAQITVAQNTYDYKSAASKEGSNYFEITEKTREVLLEQYNNDPSRKNMKALKHFERWAYTWKRKVNADGTFPSSLTGWNNILKSKPGVLNNSSSRVQNNSAATGNWIPAGTDQMVNQNGNPRPTGIGRISTIALDPSDDTDNTIYAGAATGGFWKSTDGGQTWEAKTDQLAGLGVTQITVDPDNSDIIYLAAGDFDSFEIFSQNIYKSTNKGDTWAPTKFNEYVQFGASGLTFDNQINIGDIKIIPGDDNFSQIILVTAGPLVLSSVDSNFGTGNPSNIGDTWVSRPFYSGATGNTPISPAPERLRELEVLNWGNSYQIVFTSDRTGRVFISQDFGSTFRLIKNNPDTAFNLGVNASALASSPESPYKIFIYWESGRYTSIDFTKPQGNQEVSVQLGDANGPTIDSQGEYNLTMAVAPSTNNTGLIGGVNGYKFQEPTNGGGFVFIPFLDGYGDFPGTGNFYVHADHHDFVFGTDEVTVFNANDGGVYKGSFNATASNPWEFISNGMAITQSHSVAISEQNENYLMLGNQDNDGFVKTDDGNGGYVWNMALAGDGVGCAIDYNNHLNRYLGAQFGRVFYSTNGYTTAATNEALAPSNSAAFISPLVIHPTEPNLIYRGYGDIRKLDFSNPASPTQTPLGSGLTKTTFLDVSQNGANTPVILYGIGENGARQRNFDGDWSTLTSPSAQPFTSFSVKNSTITGVDSETVYASVSGYVDSEKIYKSEDGGNTWTNISEDFPNIVVNKVFVHQTDSDNRVYAATELGLYSKDDTETEWTVHGTGLPNVIVEDLKINYANNTLYAATFGRGLWSINVEELGVDSLEVDKANVSIYPNPVTEGEVTVALEASFLANNTAKYTLYNYLGAVIKTGTLSSLKSTINVSGLATSTYILQVTSGKTTINSKLIVK